MSQLNKLKNSLHSFTHFWDRRGRVCLLADPAIQLVIIGRVPLHTMYGETLENCANFRIPVLGGFARYGAWRVQKTQLAWCSGVR